MSRGFTFGQCGLQLLGKSFHVGIVYDVMVSLVNDKQLLVTISNSYGQKQ